MSNPDEVIAHGEMVRKQVAARLAAHLPDLDVIDDEIGFTVTAYAPPFYVWAFWKDEPRPEGYGPSRQYIVLAGVVTYDGAQSPVGDGFIEVTWVDEDLDTDDPEGVRDVLPLTFVSAADLADGEPLARLAAEALLADRSVAR